MNLLEYLFSEVREKLLVKKAARYLKGNNIYDAIDCYERAERFDLIGELWMSETKKDPSHYKEAFDAFIQTNKIQDATIALTRYYKHLLNDLHTTVFTISKDVREKLVLHNEWTSLLDSLARECTNVGQKKILAYALSSCSEHERAAKLYAEAANDTQDSIQKLILLDVAAHEHKKIGNAGKLR